MKVTTFAADTGVIIFLVTGSSTRVTQMRAALGGAARLALSTLTVAEVLVRPLRDQNLTELALFDGFFGAPDVDVIGVDKDLARSAARFRADLNLKLPDRIHLAAALRAGADVFVTTDQHFDRCIGKVPIEIRRVHP